MWVLHVTPDGVLHVTPDGVLHVTPDEPVCVLCAEGADPKAVTLTIMSRSLKPEVSQDVLLGHLSWGGGGGRGPSSGSDRMSAGEGGVGPAPAPAPGGGDHPAAGCP